MGTHRHEKVAKMGHMPGDAPRGDKIRMMEKDDPTKRAKTFREIQRKKAKVKVKLRLNREMNEESRSPEREQA